jgi:hypothetical protein
MERVDQPQQPVSERGIALHQPRQLAQVNILVLHQLQNFYLKEPVGGHFPVLYQHRPAKIVPLKERKALRAGLPVLFLRLDLLRDQRNGGAAQPLQLLLPLPGAHRHKIELDIVGDLNQRHKLWFPDKVIQRQAETRGLQLAARCKQARRWLQGLQYLQDCHTGWKNIHQSLGQRFRGAVYKGRQPTRKPFKPEHHGIVEHRAGGQVAVSAEGGLWTVPEEQFVSMHPAPQIQNRLTRHIPQAARCLGQCSVERPGRYNLCSHANLPIRLSAARTL